MDQLVTYYNSYLIPFTVQAEKVVKKHKAASISIAVALAAAYFITEKVIKPPKALRQLPRPNFINFLRDSLSTATLHEIAHKYTLPAAAQNENGLYARFDAQGWCAVITSPALAKKFLLKSDLFAKVDLGKTLQGTISGKFMFGPNIVITQGLEWKKHRKIANPAFNRSMPVQLFARLTNKAFDVMEAEMENGVIDIQEFFIRWTLDAIGLAGFGFDFKAVEDKNSSWVTTYNAINDALHDIKFAIFPSLDKEYLWLFPKRQKLHKRLDEFLHMIDDVIENKRRVLKEQKESDVEESERDLLTLMIESELKGEGALTDEELKSDLCIFFVAGHDTTANALAFTMYYLAANPHIQKKARKEVIEALGDEPTDIVPTVEQTRSLRYIDCVIKETLRIASPAIGLVARYCTEDTELGGIVFPKGTRFNLDIYGLHHDPRIWDSPDDFRPERFLPGGEAEQLATSGLGMAWVPFGNGARQCIGMNFSLAEQRTMLPLLLRKYEWSLPPNSPHRERPVTTNMGILSPIDLKLKFEKRY